MATQIELKNTLKPVPGVVLSDGTTGTAIVSSGGPDSGKIIEVKDSSGKTVVYSEAVKVGGNTDNQAKINAVLQQTNSSLSLSTTNQVIAQPGYNQILGSNQVSTIGVPQGTSTEVPAAFDPAVFSNASGTNVKSTVFTFPKDMTLSGENSQDHLRIRALKYRPPQEVTDPGSFEAATTPFSSGSVLTSGLQSKNATLPPPDYEYQGEVILPMPSEVRDRSSATWGKTSMQIMSALATGAIAGPAEQLIGQGDFVGAAKQVYDNLGSAFGQTFSNASGEARSIIAASLSTAFIRSKLGLNVEPSDILARTTGKVANPNMELLFRGPDMREFTFTWTLTPRNSAEGAELRKIIKFMKLNTLPYIEGSGVLISSPNVFFIRYMKGDTRIKSLPQPKICACTTFGIDHTPSNQGWSAYEDSQAVATQLSMNFIELTPLFRNDVEIAFPDEDDVGY